jgi:hypothetical protein
MSNIIVLALGGNALGNDPEEQKEAVRHTSKSIVDLIEAGNQVILSHGNGPQVGMINLAMDAASKSEAGTPEMPFPECGAMSQGTFYNQRIRQPVRFQITPYNNFCSLYRRYYGSYLCIRPFYQFWKSKGKACTRYNQINLFLDCLFYIKFVIVHGCHKIHGYDSLRFLPCLLYFFFYSP